MKHPFNPKTLCHAMTAVLMLSCAKPLPETEGNLPPGDGDLVQVLFWADDGRSRLTNVDDEAENRIRRWTIFAFDRQDPWFTYATSSSERTLPLRLRKGRTYTCYALVNYPLSGPCAFSPASIREEAQLSGKVSTLEDNSEASLVMYGRLPVTVEEDAQQFSFPVTRTVSRVDIKSIRTDFSENPSLASKSFVLKHIYLTNLYRTTRYGSDYSFAELSASRSAWYNTMGWHRGESGVTGMDALIEARNLNIPLSAEHAYDLSHSFYVYPNPTTPAQDSHDTGQWSKRSSRIVLETSLDGEILYYQATLPEMVRNRIYSARSIVIKGKGSQDPEALVYDPENPPIIVDWNDDWDMDEEKEL